MTGAALRQLADAGVIGIVRIDVAGEILDANDAFLRLVGYTRDDLAHGRLRWDELTPPEWCDVGEQIVRSLLETGEAQPVEMDYIRKDGHLVPVLVGGALLDRVRTEAIVFAVDLTRQRATPRIAEARLAAIVTSAEDAIISKTLDGTITSWNPAAERLFGYTAREIIGRSVLTIIPPELHAEEPVIIARLARGERIEHFETFRLRKDGTRFPAALTISPVRDHTGQIIGASKILRDITVQRAMEAERALFAEQLQQQAMELEMANEQLQQQAVEVELANEQLQQQALELEMINEELQATTLALEERTRAAEEASEGKSRFLATMSHELRTPLNAIQGHVALVEDGVHGPVTGAQREALARVQRAQRHLLGLIDEVLEYARIEGGHVTYTVGPVPVRPVIEEALSMIAPQIAARGHHVEADLPENQDAPDVLVQADRERLTQVLLNLLSNAVKFTPPGGRIRVTVRVAEPGTVRIIVSDTGIGIPADALPTIFEPFVQAGRAHNRPVEGTGLGLTISRDFARGMGGELTVESTPGVGSAFTLTLPRA